MPLALRPGRAVDEIVWKDLCEVLSHPESITEALRRAHGGQWLPQELKARQENLRQGRAALGRQLERLTEAYLGEVIPLAEYQRRRKDLQQRDGSLAAQERQLQAQSRQRMELAGVAGSIEDFCERIRGGLAEATFEQRRRLVELLIDRVIVTGEEVEIRYVIPTDPSSEHVRFCHLRSDYLHHPAPRRIALLSGRVLLLLADLADMRRVAVTFDHFPSRKFVVALVQAQVLGDLLGGFGALDHNGIESGLQELEIRHVCSGHDHRKRTAVGLDKYRAFDPVLGPIGGVRAYEVPPKRAFPIAPSAACHSKSTPPSSSHSSMSLSQMRSNTPSSTHLWKVRCTDESSGNSLGNWFHWQPVLIRKMTVSKASRWSMRGLLVLFGGSCSVRIGWIFSHNWSGTRQIVGIGFSWSPCSAIFASCILRSSPIIPECEGFEIVSKVMLASRVVFLPRLRGTDSFRRSPLGE